jgi:hypothetical protein
VAEPDRSKQRIERTVRVVDPRPRDGRDHVGDHERQEQQDPEHREAANPDPGHERGQEQTDDDRQ